MFLRQKRPSILKLDNCSSAISYHFNKRPGGSPILTSILQFAISSIAAVMKVTHVVR